MLGESEMSETTSSCVYLGSNLPIIHNPGKMKLRCWGEAFCFENGLQSGGDAMSASPCLLLPAALCSTNPQEQQHRVAPETSGEHALSLPSARTRHRAGM